MCTHTPPTKKILKWHPEVRYKLWESIQYRDFTNASCGAKGRFHNPDQFDGVLLRELMHYVTRYEPFAWIRWADGEMLHLEQMHNYHVYWKTLPNLYVAVGMWWMCNGYKAQWNAFFEKNYSYIDYFYLPMGDPCDTGMSNQIKKGVHGFLAIALEAQRYIVMIGPSFLQRLPFINNFLSEANSDVNILNFIQQQPAKSIVMLSKGTHAKRIVTMAYANNTRKHTFVDVGRALNPYIGREEFGRPMSVCCENAINKSRWFMQGVC